MGNLELPNLYNSLGFQNLLNLNNNCYCIRKYEEKICQHYVQTSWFMGPMQLLTHLVYRLFKQLYQPLHLDMLRWFYPPSRNHCERILALQMRLRYNEERRSQRKIVKQLLLTVLLQTNLKLCAPVYSCQLEKCPKKHGAQK